MTITPANTIKTELGMTTNVTWTLSEPFNPNSTVHKYKVYRGYIENSDLVVRFYGGPTPTCDTNNPRISCITNGYEVGFNIADIQLNNASRYSIQVFLDPFDDEGTSNQDAILYIYG